MTHAMTNTMNGTVSGRLGGRVALVTGGTRGVGAGVARALVEAGAEVVVCARRPPDVPLPGVEFRAVDLRDRAAVYEFVEGLPRLDVLVNNVGVVLIGRWVGVGVVVRVPWVGVLMSSGMCGWWN